jgi:hypothetical protein
MAAEKLAAEFNVYPRFFRAGVRVVSSVGQLPLAVRGGREAVTAGSGHCPAVVHGCRVRAVAHPGVPWVSDGCGHRVQHVAVSYGELAGVRELHTRPSYGARFPGGVCSELTRKGVFEAEVAVNRVGPNVRAKVGKAILSGSVPKVRVKVRPLRRTCARTCHIRKPMARCP